MKNIIFIAPPAAGKGTQSDLLVARYGFEHISTGDLLREEVSKKTDLGLEISRMMESGALVSTEVVTELLTNKISSLDKPFILDGYPRTIEQADILNGILEKVHKSIGVVIYLDVPEDVLVKRATGRLTCPNCGMVFHKYYAKPKVDNICDKCGHELQSRSDDNEETFKVRYNTYIENTKPVINYYNEKGLLVNISGENPEDVFAEIEKVIM